MHGPLIAWVLAMPEKKVNSEEHAIFECMDPNIFSFMGKCETFKGA